VNSFKRKKFEDGRIIFKKGQTAGEFFIIESGKVKI
jgi:CRP-like cAMP-binding protein